MAAAFPDDPAENLALSLVREFLARKHLTATLTSLDAESPRNEHSISNRVQLAKTLGVEKLMRKNKDSESPYKTILEVVSNNLSEKVKLKNKKEDNTVQEEVTVEEEESEIDRSAMYRRIKDDGNTKSQTLKNDLVLEDAEFEGETFLGEGNVGNQRPDSGSVNNQRFVKQKQSQGRITSNLSGREQEKLKRALNKPRDGFEASRRLSEPRDGNRCNHDHERYQVSERSNQAGSQARTTSAESASSAKSRTPPMRENSGSIKSERKSVDVRKVLRGVEDATENERKTTTVDDAPERKTSREEVRKKPKSKAELLSMLEMKDPTRKISNASEESSQSSVEKSVEVTPAAKLGDLELDDLDEDELMESDIIETPKPKIATWIRNKSVPIDLKTAQDLKKIIFGSPQQQFYDEWKLQGFTFFSKGHVKYGIVQKKGGPCGVLAAVQACVIQELLFGANYDPTRRRLKPGRSERTDALIEAICTILWRCGDGKSAVVALPGSRAFFPGSSKFKADGLTEFLMLTRLDDWKELSQFVRSNITIFEADGSPGVILLLYSAILSRTIDGIRSDMDDPDGQLMGQHFYCTQDMVNLLLTGHAWSNSFNDVIKLGDGDDVTILKGLTRRSDIGFLSLFEHFKSCQVGTYFKTPKYPVWVVCCESHYSVIFACKKELVSDWKAERRFDVFFYDGLSDQEEEIVLTLDTAYRVYEPPADEDMVPPLENCIRTKWPEAAIDWNGTEPLL